MNNISMISLESGNDRKYTSLQIAEWTGKRHDNVLRDIRDEMESLGEIGKLIFEEKTHINKNNQQMPMYEMDKDGVMQIAARYDAVVRYKLIQKLKELEIPSYQIEDPVERANKWIDEYKEKQKLLGENEDLKIKLNESNKYYTIMKYNQTHNLGWNMKDCQTMGKRVSFHCRQNGYEVKKCETNDERFKQVNSYPIKAIIETIGIFGKDV